MSRFVKDHFLSWSTFLKICLFLLNVFFFCNPFCTAVTFLNYRSPVLFSKGSYFHGWGKWTVQNRPQSRKRRMSVQGKTTTTMNNNCDEWTGGVWGFATLLNQLLESKSRFRSQTCLLAGTLLCCLFSLRSQAGNFCQGMYDSISHGLEFKLQLKIHTARFH